MASRPLIVAGVASALLVALLVADATMNRTAHLDVRADEGWRHLATDPPPRYDAEPVPLGPFGRGGPDVLQANETVEMRLRIDNGYPWAYDETFRAYANGVEVASGRLTAPARGEGEATFSFSTSVVSGQPAYRAAPEAPDARSLDVLVVAGDARLGAFFEVRGESS